MSKQQWYQDLIKQLDPKNIKIDEALNLHTMTRMGGMADLFVTPVTEDEAAFVVQYAYENNIPLLLLGNGSNMVVRDGGVRGIVLRLEKLKQYHD